MKGLVVKSTGSWYKVAHEDGTLYNCRIKGKFRLDDSKTTNPITVGDHIEFSLEEDGSGVITHREERKNYIIRKSVNLSKQSHIIAANVDRAYLITTITQPNTLLSFVDRFLVSAEAYRIPVTIICNKIDVYKKKDIALLEQWEDAYSKAGYPLLRISCVTGENIDALRHEMNNNISVVAGNSGVGKSTILNTIEPTLQVKTQKISVRHKSGQHTTTFAEMFALSGGGYVIDTPGIRAFGLLDFEKQELHHFFPEIFSRSAHCKFHNCTHIHEPDCAVIPAVEHGEIAYSRYENYVAMYCDTHNKHR